jgi:hypothetical protein
MVTFETKVWENDYGYLLNGDLIDKMISRCNYDFTKKVLYINNVRNVNEVKKLADKKVKKGVLDQYYIVDDYSDEVLDYFGISKASFKGGYYYSIAELIGIYLCETEYLLHFSSDSILEASEINWIDKALKIFQSKVDVIVANPVWSFRFNEAKKESFSELQDFYLGYGFSDHCYLIPTDVFKNKIYNEIHIDSARYPRHGGESFEKRVDSYMRNHKQYRITSNEISYIHKSFPRNIYSKWLYKIINSRL